MIEAGSSRKVALDIMVTCSSCRGTRILIKPTRARLTVRVEKASGEVRVS